MAASVADPSDTRGRLIDAAITLYAVKGIDAVSLREIGQAAGQRNTSAVNYHFGDQGGLIEAIIEQFPRRHPHFFERAAKHLPSGRCSVRQVASAMVRPLAELLDADPEYLQFIAHLHAGLGRAEFVMRLPAAQWFAEIEAILEARLGLSPEDLRSRFAVTLAVQALADQAHHAGSSQTATESFVDELVTVVAAILAAPRAKPTRVK